MTFDAKKILLVGFAREGQATLRFLQRTAPSADVTLCDANPIAGHAELRKFCGKTYLQDASKEKYDLVLRSPGIPPQKITPYFPRIPVRTATSLFLEQAPGIVIGVTGTKGKSTTASLIAHLLATKYEDVRLVGNIGKPALDYLEGASEQTFFVCELSSFQLEDAAHSPTIAVLLPIVPEHLDHHGSFEAYAAAKYTIFKYQARGQLLVTKREGLPFLPQEIPSKILAVDKVARWKDDELYIEEAASGLVSGQLLLRGAGAKENICYAVAVARQLEVTAVQITEALKNIEPLPHRLEIVGEQRSVLYVNDSLCTVPEALMNALDAFRGRVSVLIAGGHDRGICYDVLGPALAEAKLQKLLLFHGTGEKIEKAARVAGVSCEIIFIDSMQQAVELAAASAPANSVVLLSPASSSFGLFKDYADRGEQFKQAVWLIERK